MLAGDMQVADVAPAAVPGQPFALLDDLDLDVADYLPAQHRRQAGPVDADRSPDRQPGQWRPRWVRQVAHPGEVDHLGVPGVSEPGPLIQGPDVRPLLGHTVNAPHGQLAL